MVVESRKQLLHSSMALSKINPLSDYGDLSGDLNQGFTRWVILLTCGLCKEITEPLTNPFMAITLAIARQGKF